MTALSVVSLFSGCGGFDVGFENQGYELRASFDNNLTAVECYNNNLRGRSKVQDIRQDFEFPESDVLLATPPCQGFSPIGKLHPNDTRNNLLIRGCEIAAKRRPKVFIIENVFGLAHRPNDVLLKNAISILSNANYFTEIHQASCEELGLPQRRKRLFIVSRLGNRPFHIHLPTLPKQTVAEAFARLASGLVDETKELEAGTKDRIIAERIKPGQKLSNVRRSSASVHTWDIPEVFGEVTAQERELLNEIIRLRRTERIRSNGDADPVAVARLEATLGTQAASLVSSLLNKAYLKKVGEKIDLQHTFNGNYRRLKYDCASPTVDTHFGNPRLFLHPEKHRGISRDEAAILQGFPRSYKWPASKGTSFRLIGNAVPPPVGQIIANITRTIL